MERRDRQLAEIASLVANDEFDRAQGLAFEHVAEFPDDDGALTSVLRPHGG